MTKKNTQSDTLDEEIVFEDEDFPTDKIKKLKDKLKKCESEKQEFLNGWQRSQADLINIKKRSEEDKASFARYANENIILDIIPTLDSFDQAFKNKKVWDAIDKNWRMGVEFIYSQLLNSLKSHGVEEINPLNEQFDPQIHESVGTLEGEDGIILEIVLKGYKLNNKIIRAPQVRVGEKE